MTETQLTRLKPGAHTLLDDNPGFLRGDDGEEWLDEGELDRFTEDTPHSADVETLEERLRGIKETTKEHSGEVDIEAAEVVHKSIPLSPAAASDSGIWNDLAIRHFPWFVRHRWNFQGKTAMKNKFWTAGTQLDGKASTFERLWWIAELTHEGGDYENTRRAFQSRTFCNRVFDIKLGRYKPATLACLEVLYDEDADDFVSNDVVNDTLLRFRRVGSTIPFEGRTKDELVPIVEKIKQDELAQQS